MKNFSKLICLVILIFTLSTFMVGADSFEDELFGSSDEQSLFISDDSFIVDVEESDTSLDTLLLSDEDETVRIGGQFSFTATPGFTWNIDDNTTDGTFAGSIDTLTFVDARVSDDVRAYTSVSLSYPFSGNADFALKEAFVDLTYNDNIFVRSGKQIINWGVGYFFSPADVLNISDIDPENASEDVEGPIAIKVNASLGVDNLYTYVIVPPDLTDASDLAYAVKYEKVLGGTEFGFGGYYRYDNPPSAQITFSSGIGEIALFGEGVLQYGSHKNFITGPATTTSYDDRFFFLGTLGGRFSYDSPESDFSLSLIGQYFYNGEGYEDTDMYSFIPTILPLAAGGTVEFSPFDLIFPGRHYLAAHVSSTFTTDMSASLFVLANMTDLSGIISPTISFSFIDNINISLSAHLTYGADGTEYTFSFNEDTFQVESARYLSPSVSITFGSISF